MLEIEPKSLIFLDVCLNQAYSKSFRLTNTYSAPVEITLRPSSPRYTIAPNHVNLTAGQSVVVTSRLFISHFPNYAGGVRGHEDHISIKSSFFEQKLAMTFYLQERGRSRSPSPVGKQEHAKAVRSEKEELHSQIENCNNTIVELEGIIDTIEAKNPDLQEAVRRHVMYERHSFEEKSEKVLGILSRKDDQLSELKEELRMSHQRNEQLENRVTRLSEEPSFNASLTEEGHHDMQALREKSFDQAEQIQSLLQEVTHFREEENSASQKLHAASCEHITSINVAEAEIAQLRITSQNLESKIQTLMDEKVIFLRKEESLQAKHDDEMSQKNYQLERLQQMLDQKTTELIASKSEFVEYVKEQANQNPVNTRRASNASGFEQDEPERQRWGPQSDLPWSAKSLDHLPSTMHEVEALYKERLQRADALMEEQRFKIELAVERENEMDNRTRELEVSLAAARSDVDSFCETLRTTNAEKERMSVKISDLELDLVRTKLVVDENQKNLLSTDGHTWWAYVWHECCKQKRIDHENGVVAINATTSVGPNEGDDQPNAVSLQHNVDTLRDQMKSLAIELASVRQNMLARQLSNKQEVTDLREQLATSHRENMRLIAHARTHHEDGNLKLEEMKDTIKMMSAKGDVYSQFITARQELETERLTVWHLRAELETYRSTAAQEQQKLTAAKKENLILQSSLDSSLVAQTVLHVPGVDPATLIELFSQQIIRMKNETSAAMGTNEELMSQIQTYQRLAAVASAPEVHTVAAGDGAVSGKGESSALSNWRDKYNSALKGLSTNPAKQLKEKGKLSSPLSTDDSMSSMYVNSEAKLSSSPRSNLFSNADSFAILVDGNSSPQAVVESLDAAALAQKVLSQEMVIENLQVRLVDTESEVLKVENIRLWEIDQYEQNGRIELESAVKRKELLELALQESKHECALQRTRIQELERECLAITHVNRGHSEEKSEVQSAVDKELGETSCILGQHVRLPSLAKRHKRKAAKESGGVDDISMSCVADEEENSDSDGYSAAIERERDELKSLLLERTSQLKTLTDTVEALHTAGYTEQMLFPSADTDMMNPQGPSNNPLNPLESLASMPLYPNDAPVMDSHHSRVNVNVNNSWGVQALVKRVVELSTELTSQCSLSGMEERRAAQAEALCQIKSKEIQQLRSKLKSEQDIHTDKSLQMVAVNQQMKFMETTNTENMNILRHEHEELLSTCREMDIVLAEQSLIVDELRKQVKVTEGFDFKNWLDRVITNHSAAANSDAELPAAVWEVLNEFGDGSENASGSAQPVVEDVKTMIQSLLVVWKKEVGLHSKGSSSPSSIASAVTLTKSEQKFLQRICDMVLAANERCAKAVETAANATQASTKSELSLKICEEKLKSSLQQLHRYRRRALASEQLVNTDSQHESMLFGKIVCHLRKENADLRMRVDTLSASLHGSQRDHLLSEVRHAGEGHELSMLKSQLALLESKGNAILRARENALNSLDHRFKSSEESLHKWFKTELPRLVTGLPVIEDCVGSVETLTGHEVPYNSAASSDFEDPDSGSPQSRWLASMGLDRTFALSQALCTSKALQATQDMKIVSLTEKNSVLKERVCDLEGLVIRWKENIENSPFEYGQDIELQQKASEAVKVEEELKQSLVVEKNKWEEKVLVLEEEIIEAKGRLSHALDRSTELTRLTESVMQDENMLKAKATEQMTRLKIDLERNHATELRKLREQYEVEKTSLTAELDEVAGTLKHGHHYRHASHTHEHTEEKEVAGVESADAPQSRSRSNSVEHQHRSRTRASSTDSKGSPPPNDRYATSTSLSPAAKENKPIDLRAIIAQRLAKEEQIEGNLPPKPTETENPYRDIVNNDVLKPIPPAHVTEERVNKFIYGDNDEDSLDNAGEVYSTSVPVLQQRVRQLQREIEGERLKYTQAKAEIEELEQLLNVQRAEFTKHLDQESLEHGSPHKDKGSRGHGDIAANAVNDSPTSTLSSSAEGSSSSDHHRPSKRSHSGGRHKSRDSRRSRKIQVEEEEFSPSLPTMVTEVGALLRDVTNSHFSLFEKDERMRVAISILERMSGICDKSGRSRGQPEYAGHDNGYESSGSSSSSHSSSSTSGEEDALWSYQRKSSKAKRGDTTQVTKKLQSLSSRVKSMEKDFKQEKYPAKHLQLLRDLRIKVADVESNMQRVLHEQKSLWNSSKHKLENQLHEAESQLQHSNEQQDLTLNRIKQRYEKALSESHEALESQTAASTAQVEYLEHLLFQQQTPGPVHKQERDGMFDSTVSTVGSVDSFQQKMETIVKHQKSLYDQIQQQRNEDADAGKLGQDDLEKWKNMFSQYQHQQGRVHRLKENVHQYPGHPVSEGNVRGGWLEQDSDTSTASDLPQPGQPTRPRQEEQSDEAADSLNISLEDANDAIRQLQYQFNTKSRQLDTVIRTLSNANGGIMPDDSFFGANDTLNTSNVSEESSLDHSYAAVKGDSRGNSARMPDASRGHLDQYGGHGVSNQTRENDHPIHSYLDNFRAPQVADSEPYLDNNLGIAERFHRKVNSGVSGSVSSSLHPPAGSVAQPPHRGQADVIAETSQNTELNMKRGHPPPALVHPHPTSDNRYHPYPASASTVGGNETGNIPTKGYNNSSFDSKQDLYLGIQTGLLEARVQAAEEEVHLMHMSLSQERRIVAELRAQIRDMNAHVKQEQTPKTVTFQGVVGAVEGATAIGVSDRPAEVHYPSTDESVSASGHRHTAAPTVEYIEHKYGDYNTDPLLSSEEGRDILAPPDANERMKLLIARMNEMRRNAKGEIFRLKQSMITMKVGSDAHAEEIMKLKTASMEYKEQLQTVREDNTRKAKLIAAHKATKLADGNALNQWKKEAEEHDDRAKRLQRSIVSKDSMIKDLKSRLDKAVSEHQSVVQRIQHTGGPTGSSSVPPSPTTLPAATGNTAASSADTLSNSLYESNAALTAAELRNKLRVSELERLRGRTRLAALKEKINAHEAEMKILVDDRDREKRLAEKAEGLRSTLTRKETQLKQVKLQLDKTKVTIAELEAAAHKDKLDTDKSVKHLQREISILQRERDDLKKEMDLMRTRHETSLEKAVFASHDVPTDDRSVGHRKGASSRAGAAGTSSNRPVRFNTVIRNQSPVTTQPAERQGDQHYVDEYYSEEEEVPAAEWPPTLPSPGGIVASSSSHNTGPSQRRRSPTDRQRFDHALQDAIPVSLNSSLGDLEDVLHSLGEQGRHITSSTGTGMRSGRHRSPLVNRGPQGEQSSPSEVEQRLNSLVRGALSSGHTTTASGSTDVALRWK